MGDELQPARIRVLPADLADQIAAGEVVERPASVIKELVDNAIDAGARRVEIELEAGGVERIAVTDDGAGIPPDDLVLAITRHATSKLGSAADLVEPRTLGFRGEALASIAAVAHLEIASRTAQHDSGTRLRVRPGLAPELEHCGMAPGTRVDVRGLFANVPARRKFLRATATEVGHCAEVVTRLGLVHPEVSLRLRHDGRVVVDLPRAQPDERVEQVLARRGGRVVQCIAGEWDGIAIRVFLGGSARERGDVLVVVRRRVVRERSIAQIVRDDHRRRHGGAEPIACVFVEPPSGTVDVNVHPQKAEVRFSDPQTIYAAMRRALSQTGLAPAPERYARPPEPAPIAPGREHPGVTPDTPSLPGLDAPADPAPIVARETATPTYRLGTRAIAADYEATRERLRADARALAELRATTRVDEPRGDPSLAEPDAAPTDEPAIAADDAFELLTCLPGPIAILRVGDDLLAADLRAIRTHLVQRRLTRELGEGRIVAQALLVPAVVALPTADVELCASAIDVLAELGIVAERFGDDALLVRAVPAALRGVVDDLQASELVLRLLPWLRLRVRSRDRAPDDDGVASIVARAADREPAISIVPRLARRFLRELVADGTPLDRAPGIRRWRADELVAPRGSGRT